MGRSEPRKGARIERELVNLFQAAGIPAERVPLSGAAGGSFSGDLVIDGRYRAEVKARGSGAGFVTLERWKGANDLLFLRRDRKPSLVVMDADTLVALILAANDTPSRIAPGIVQDLSQ